MVVRWLVTSGGHCGGNACGRRWLFWELEVMWPERSPPAGGGSEGLRAPFLRIVPLFYPAVPWAQGMPSTSLRVPWAPALSSYHAWGSLVEMVTTVGAVGGPQWAPTDLGPCKQHSPLCLTAATRGDGSRHSTGGKGRSSQPAQSLPAFHKRIADCQVSCLFLILQPCPWSGKRCHLLCTEPWGRGEERVPCPLGCYASMTWGVCLWAIKVPRWWGFFSVWGSPLLCFLVLRINLLIICVFFCFVF